MADIALMPAPAVTYVGEVKLPAMITLAIIPLAPGADLSDIPQITSQATDAATTWALPIDAGTLQLLTTIEHCEIVK